jgi:hypothetical protein
MIFDSGRIVLLICNSLVTLNCLSLERVAQILFKNLFQPVRPVQKCNGVEQC